MDIVTCLYIIFVNVSDFRFQTNEPRAMMIHHKEVSQKMTAVTLRMKTKMRMNMSMNMKMRMSMSPRVKMEALQDLRYMKSQVMMRKIV